MALDILYNLPRKLLMLRRGFNYKAVLKDLGADGYIFMLFDNLTVDENTILYC
jgi:hypothetical protein